MKPTLSCILFLSLDLALLCATAPAAPLQDAEARSIGLPTTDDVSAMARGLAPDAGLALPLFDEPGDGALWVLGTNYKARFDARGLEFVPFLGSDAPQNYPIGFSIASARVGERELDWATDLRPERQGSTVTYHRGAFDERFDIGADSIEQSFVLDRRVSGGDLVIAVHVEGELERTSDALGTHFVNERGGVTYGSATLVDVRGEQLVSATHLVGDSIVICTPRHELERAQFPLTVDPVITSFLVNSSTKDSFDADVSFDLDTNTFLCVFEEVYSAADHDVVARQLDGLGNVVANGTTYIDFTSLSWTHPKVANNNAQNQFMVAAKRYVTEDRIAMRTRSATSTAMSSQGDLAINTFSPGYDAFSAPDIGGDSYPNGTPSYCVVWAGASS